MLEEGKYDEGADYEILSDGTILLHREVNYDDFASTFNLPQDPNYTIQWLQATSVQAWLGAGQYVLPFPIDQSQEVVWKEGSNGWSFGERRTQQSSQNFETNFLSEAQTQGLIGTSQSGNSTMELDASYRQTMLQNIFFLMQYTGEIYQLPPEMADWNNFYASFQMLPNTAIAELGREVSAVANTQFTFDSNFRREGRLTGNPELDSLIYSPYDLYWLSKWHELPQFMRDSIVSLSGGLLPQSMIDFMASPDFAVGVNSVPPRFPLVNNDLNLMLAQFGISEPVSLDFIQQTIIDTNSLSTGMIIASNMQGISETFEREPYAASEASQLTVLLGLIDRIKSQTQNGKPIFGIPTQPVIDAFQAIYDSYLIRQEDHELLETANESNSFGQFLLELIIGSNDIGDFALAVDDLLKGEADLLTVLSFFPFINYGWITAFRRGGRIGLGGELIEYEIPPQIQRLITPPGFYTALGSNVSNTQLEYYFRARRNFLNSGESFQGIFPNDPSIINRSYLSGVNLNPDSTVNPNTRRLHVTRTNSSDEITTTDGPIINYDLRGQTVPLSQMNNRTARSIVNDPRFAAGVYFDSNGFPDFSPYAIAVVVVDNLTGDRVDDESTANKLLGFPKPTGYTWHHHQDGVTMLLVPTLLHRAYGHTGGSFILENR
jgi:hypothetical protein